MSKLAGENYCLVKYLMDDAPVTVVRYSNVYGPWQSPYNNPYCGVVGKFIESAAGFQEIVDQQPEYDYGWFLLGMAFIKMNRKFYNNSSPRRKDLAV